MRIGYVDIVERDRIEGWAADPEAPDDVLELLVLVDGRPAGRVPADRLRLDLRNSGRFGAGRHGFLFAFTPPLDPAADHDVVVCFAASEAPLIRGAFKLRRPEPAGRSDLVEFHEGSLVRGAPPAAPPRYVLHVGLPKTGTKYLQHNFWRLRGQLRERGVYYPSQWWTEQPLFAHHELAESLREVPDRRTADIVAALNACGAPVVLLSSEGFYGVPEGGLAYLRSLMGEAKIDVVVYTRRWSDWIPSQWQQAVKQGSLQTFPEWLAVLLSTADRHPGINQALFLDKFAKVFGRENIRLVSYSNLMDREVDLFEHFCTQILHLPEPPVAGDRGSLVHESMGIFLTELIRGLNADETLRGQTPGYHVFRAYERIKAEPAIADDVKLLFAAMEQHLGELTIDDNAGLFDYSYNRIGEYRDVLVSPEYGAQVFARQARQARYVRPDYLLQPRVPEALARVCQRLSGPPLPDAAGEVRHAPPRPRAGSVAIMTMVYNESVALPIWLRHYRRTAPNANLFVIDHATADGSTADLSGAATIPLPRDKLDERDRVFFISALQQAFLRYYDTVIYTDCDELLVADPARSETLEAYLATKQYAYASPVGINVIHMVDIEPPLDLTRPILSQRRFAQFDSQLCKPLVTRIPLKWEPGFHSADQPFNIDNDLYLFHIKQADRDVALRRHATSQSISWSSDAIASRHWGHHRIDADEFLRRLFLNPSEERVRRGVGAFTFDAEIARLVAESGKRGNAFYAPTFRGAIVEIPEVFRDAF